MKTIFLLLFLLPFSVWASSIKVTSLNYQDEGRQGKVTISLNREIDQLPELLVREKMIQVSIPNSFVWPKIDKNISVYKNYDAKVSAYQFSKDNVRVRTMLPYNVKAKEDLISMEMIGGKIVVTFPKKKTIKAKVKKKAVKTAYDTSYLDKLLKDQMKNEDVKLALPTQKKKKIEGKDNNASVSIKDDQVALQMAGIEKEEKEGFSVMNYIAKFAGFLALVLLLFYGVMTFLRKGAMSKGKLGFLNSTKMVEVLSTTYVGPKKNLLLIRAHNQVFLVSNSDQGMNLISELDDVNGLLKEGEKRVAGSNFDSELVDADEKGKVFSTKETLDSFSEEVSPKVEDKVKLSDQIKSKVKGLKSLQ